FIDPSLTWNTFLGSSTDDVGQAVTVDASGNVYVAGYSNATWGSPVRAFSGDYAAFSAKQDSSGSLTWNTFLVSSSDDDVHAVAVDASGNVYVAGYSYSSSGSPLRPFFSRYTYATLVRFDTSASLTWNTFLGSSDYDFGFAVTVDGSGNVYVAGYSYATWGSPVTAFSGCADAFAAKLDSSGNLTWNTSLGSSTYEAGNAIA